MRKWRGTGRSRRKEIHKWDVFYEKNLCSMKGKKCVNHIFFKMKES